MKQYPLIGVSIIVVVLLVLGSSTNAVGYQSVKSTNLSDSPLFTGNNQDMYPLMDKRGENSQSYVLDSIEIDDLKGGFGISAVIRNTGEIIVSDIAWSIDFGKLAIGKYSSGTISTISAGDEVVIRSGFVFGIGPGSVKVVAGDFSIVQKYIMIGPFIFLKKGLGNQIKNDDMIVYYRDGNMKTLDPADAYDDESMNVISNIYDTLVTFRGNDSQTFYPCLATDWAVSNNSLTWTFHLRENVKFSNGNDFTAEDVKYSFNRVLLMNSPETGVAWILGQCMDPNSTTVINNHTVQIRLTQSYGGFLALLAHTVAAIVDKDYVEANGGVVPGEENIWMKEHPMGTGPYVLDHWTQGTEIFLNKNPNYWGGWNGNHIEKVFFKTTPNLEERISAIKKGDADIIDVPYENLGEVIGEKGIVFHPFDSFDVAILMMNTRASNNEFLADGRVRKAFSYAFDYDTAIDTALRGYASRLAGAIPRGMPYYETQNNGQPYYSYNLTMAEQILDDAGYVKNYLFHGTLYRFNGTTIRLFYNIGNSEREMIAGMFQAALNKIGILSSVTAEEWPQYLNRIYDTEDWEIAFLGWIPDFNDPDDYIAPFVGSNAIGGDTFNTGWANTTVDQMILTGKHNVDPQIRSDAYTEAFNIYINEPSLMFIGQRMFVRPMRNWIMNYSYNPAPGLRWKFYDCYKGYNEGSKPFPCT